MSKSTIDLDRRGFLKAGAAGSLAAAVGGRTLLERGGDDSDTVSPEAGDELVKTVCTHCSVGCGLQVGVEEDAVVGQEPWEDNPVNQGGLCSKGASLTQSVNSEQRLKRPLKLVDGEWEAMDWDEILDEIAGRLDDIREETGPHATFWAGSAKHSNEAAYLIRKLAAFYGTNNIDHQARICHSTTVEGIANTWGVGAMTNNSNDMRNVDVNLIIGHNPLESHPVAWQYFQEAQQNGGKHIVAEPRYTKTAAAADDYYQFRSGTDVAFIYGLIYHIVENLEAHDEEFIESRVVDWQEFREEILHEYDLETVSDICGIEEEELMELAEELADADVSCVEWAMGGTQHNNATGNVRAYAMLNLTLGHAAQPGGGTPIFRGHDNVQGATDLGVDSSTLPGYYGLDPGAWEHWANVWSETNSTSGEISYDELVDRFHSTDLMEKNGFTVARWYEGVLDDDWEIYQPDPLRAAIFWGHGLASLTEYGKVREAVNELDFIVNIDVFPNQVAELAESDTDVYMLPVGTNLEESGSVVNTGRQIQWRSQAIEPRHDAKKDWKLLCEFADRLGFGDHFDYDEVEDVTREFNLGVRSVGYVGHTPERLKAHQENSHLFSAEDLQVDFDDLDVDEDEVDGVQDGEYYGLPWPCWHEDHPGTPILYDAAKHPSEGGMDFRARWGVEGPDDQDLLRDPYEPDWWDGEIEGVPQYPGYSTVLPDPENPAAATLPMEYAEDETQSVYDTALELAEGDYDVDIDPEEYAEFDNPQPDSVWGRGRARMRAWNLTDEYPVHREPAVTPRPDLVDDYPCNDRVEDHWRVELDNAAVQQENIDAVEELEDAGDVDPMVLTSGRQVEHKGAGSVTRSTQGTASRAPMMYLEIHPDVADELGVEEGDWIAVTTPHAEMFVQARPTERVAPDHAFAPYHWAGILEGEKVTDSVPDGMEPLVIGESINCGTAPAYDRETQMQETKTTLCNVRVADDDEIPELSERQLRWQEQRMERDKR
ncbi:molybdopterin-dependent oxidoreductase [Natronolimnohabitans sp. A-GB9]|uniref:molybdopterin-dependent oxidoreductase n=1 Tax=Natronolimnohabitans sp. A-GB9 TaxID=3069757 RepID=UPI0027B41B78|nr:molybdopterin-dependent oxidoreductase [Natronolimnohabitans sp. A-GB9]MDQ2050641.1 molybdopterin-dependent oxidoreductase [Natronolimnohabitans sp. A-GB9]